MRTRKTPTRLELHRLKFNQNGRRGSLLRFQDLDAEERDLLQQELLQDVRVKRIDFTGPMDEKVFDSVQMEVYAEWGVMCPHPHSSLRSLSPEKKDKKLPNTLKELMAMPRAFHECGVCGCIVFPSSIGELKVVAKK